MPDHLHDEALLCLGQAGDAFELLLQLRGGARLLAALVDVSINASMLTFNALASSGKVDTEMRRRPISNEAIC